MFKRPHPKEDDAEILRLQEEFFKSKSTLKPAASIIDGSIKSNCTVSTKIESKTSTESREIKNIDDNQYAGPSEINIEEQIANTFEAIPSTMELNAIVERKQQNIEQKDKSAFLSCHKTGFPKAIRRDLNVQPRQGSIFSQHMKKFKPKANQSFDKQNISLVVKDRNSKNEIKKIGNATACSSQYSSILSHSDKDSIHKENLEKLNSMSEKEIMAEREKLISSMDPALIEFLKRQRSEIKEPIENRNTTIKEQNEVGANINLDDLNIPKQMMSMPESAGWINFNKFEANKLAWMKDINMNNLKKTEGFEARFDFEGYLLPYNISEINEQNRHLYHHGDEPERPGYSLQELLLLSRSNVIQQKIIALNTLANILSLDQTGIYDDIIDIPIEQIFFVIRISLDVNVPSILNAAVKALRNLVYFQIDEICLDNMFSFGIGLIQPILAIDNDEVEDDNTVNDQQLAETNLVKCFIRTDLLIRLRYIINVVKPSLETIVYCIEILIRMARDSEFIVNKIFECDGLISNLIQYFLPHVKLFESSTSLSGYNMPLSQIIKLIRILSARNRQIADTLLKKYNLLEIVLSYLSSDYFSQNATGMHLQAECLYYWTTILHFGLALESVKDYQCVILNLLSYHWKNSQNLLSTTLIRQKHIAALLILLSKTIEKEYNLFPDILAECFERWLNQFCTFDSFKCGQSQITSAVFHISMIYDKYFGKFSISNLDLIERIIKSKAFENATENITNCSLLLNNYVTHKTTANLKSLEAATWFAVDHIVPVMQTNSCIPFLYSLSDYVLNNKSIKMKIYFLNHPNIVKYTEKLRKVKHYYNTGNWFSRCESFLIMNILKISQNIRNDIDPSMYYDIAVKSLCIFSVEQKQQMEFLMENIIFSSNFYPLEISLANITTTENPKNELSECCKHLKDIEKVYRNIFGLTTDIINYNITLSINMNISNVIPIDWIYSPLILLYANQQKKLNNNENPINSEQTDLFIIINCLRWVLLYETYFESLAQAISPTEKYVRLGCIFLGSDSLFLNVTVENLLRRIYGFIVKYEKRINFEEEISGLTNFKDFYIQLLEQYQAVSYGNKVFGNVILFPLVKRHDIKYRKTLWSEYMGVVETLSVEKDDVRLLKSVKSELTVMKYDLWLKYEDLLYPVDTDSSLCKSYLKALKSNAIQKKSVLYEIAEISIKEIIEKRVVAK